MSSCLSYMQGENYMKYYLMVKIMLAVNGSDLLHRGKTCLIVIGILLHER